MTCAYCKYTDGLIYTSNPPKLKCTITGEYHLALDDCNVEFAPVKHGTWLEENRRPKSMMFYCSECHRTAYDPQNHTAKGSKRCRYAFCPNCGAKMDGEEDAT